MPAAPIEIVVGGVAELWQGDLDLGRRAVERLAAEELGDGVLVEELSYGAVAVAQRLQELEPRLLILVGAAERGRRPGTVERREIDVPCADPAVAQAAVGDAVVGYVSIDLLLEVAAAFGALPAETVAIEVEPRSTAVSTELTPEGAAGLERAVELVRREVRARRALSA